MAGTIVAKTGVKRKKGYLYFVDGNGNVRMTKMKRGGTKGAHRCASKKKATKAKPRKKARTRASW